MKKALCIILVFAACVCCFASCTKAIPEYDLPPVEEITQTYLSAVVTDIPDKDTLKVDVCKWDQKYFGKTATVKLGKIYSDDISIGEEVYIGIDRIEGETYFTIYAERVILTKNAGPVDKPVIYLYPEEETVCSVKVELDGELTCTYPEHGENGWQNFIAYPDGTLIFPDGKEYYCLYWEGVSEISPDLSKGFCVKGEDTADFLSDTLLKIGLTPREANEFIIYWLPLLQENEFNLISFQSEAYTDISDLIIDPMPDSLLRVFMTYKPLTKPIDIEPQEFSGFIREGFTVVEWGGGIWE